MLFSGAGVNSSHPKVRGNSPLWVWYYFPIVHNARHLLICTSLEKISICILCSYINWVVHLSCCWIVWILCVLDVNLSSDLQLPNTSPFHVFIFHNVINTLWDYQFFSFFLMLSMFWGNLYSFNSSCCYSESWLWLIKCENWEEVAVWHKEMSGSGN